MSPVFPLIAGTLVHGHRVVRLLGSGGFGFVYEVETGKLREVK